MQESAWQRSGQFTQTPTSTCSPFGCEGRIERTYRVHGNREKLLRLFLATRRRPTSPSRATAIITEATLSFLGVGVPPTSPSLGTLIRVGNDYLFSGEWWITIFPGAMLILIALSVNLLGDWLRDALNPRLR